MNRSPVTSIRNLLMGPCMNGPSCVFLNCCYDAYASCCADSASGACSLVGTCAPGGVSLGEINAGNGIYLQVISCFHSCSRAYLSSNPSVPRNYHHHHHHNGHYHLHCSSSSPTHHLPSPYLLLEPLELIRLSSALRYKRGLWFILVYLLSDCSC